MLLQFLNDRNDTAIKECLAIVGVNVWINYPVLPKLLENRIRQFIDVESITCLTFASLVSTNETVRLLVEAGADIAVTDSRGYSTLHYACASDIDAEDKIAYLVQRGASPQKATDGSKETLPGPEFYSTSLLLAASLNQAGRVRALIDDHGVSVNATGEYDRTALHHAAEAGSAEAVKVLVQHPDCRVNATSSMGRTPLHDAAYEGNIDCVNVLVSHPNCDFTDRRGRTVAVVARERGHDDIAALIEAKSTGKFFSVQL